MPLPIARRFASQRESVIRNASTRARRVALGAPVTGEVHHDHVVGPAPMRQLVPERINDPLTGRLLVDQGVYLSLRRHDATKQ